MNNFSLRLISTLFLLILLSLLLFSNNFVKIFIIEIFLFLSLWETMRLINFRKDLKNFDTLKIDKNDANFLLTRKKIHSFDFLIIFLIIITNLFFLYNSFNLLSAFFIIFSTLLICKIYKSSSFNIFCILYVSIPFFILAELINSGEFKNFMILVLYFSILTDVSSYLFGKIIGGKKILPKISPGKTISGTIGGIIFPVIISVLIFEYKDNFQLILFLIIICVTVQAGDLIESYFKRLCSTKDSSNLIPGHGGILDRLDGVFLLILLVFLFKKINHNFLVL